MSDFEKLITEAELCLEDCTHAHNITLLVTDIHPDYLYQDILNTCTLLQAHLDEDILLDIAKALTELRPFIGSKIHPLKEDSCSPYLLQLQTYFLDTKSEYTLTESSVVETILHYSLCKKMKCGYHMPEIPKNQELLSLINSF